MEIFFLIVFVVHFLVFLDIYGPCIAGRGDLWQVLNVGKLYLQSKHNFVLVNYHLLVSSCM